MLQSDFAVRKVHRWRGTYERTLVVSPSSISTWVPHTDQCTNSWPWSEVASVVQGIQPDEVLLLTRHHGLFGLTEVACTRLLSSAASSIVTSCLSAQRSREDTQHVLTPGSSPVLTDQVATLLETSAALRRDVAAAREVADRERELRRAERAELDVLLAAERDAAAQAVKLAEHALQATEGAQRDVVRQAAEALQEAAAQAKRADAAEAAEAVARAEAQAEREACKAAVERVAELSLNASNAQLRAEMRIHHAASLHGERVVRALDMETQRRCFHALRLHAREGAITRQVAVAAAAAEGIEASAPGPSQPVDERRASSDGRGSSGRWQRLSSPAEEVQLSLLARQLYAQAHAMAEAVQLSACTGRAAAGPTLQRYTQSGIAVGAYVGLASLGSSSRSLVGRGSSSPTPRFSHGSGSPYTPFVATPSEASCALEGGAIHSEASCAEDGRDGVSPAEEASATLVSALALFEEIGQEIGAEVGAEGTPQLSPALCPNWEQDVESEHGQLVGVPPTPNPSYQPWDPRLE